MNELKPEDVMRALECCIKTQCENCCNLGNWHEQWNCMTDLMKKALALLREKDALLEEWDAKCKDYETELIGKCMDIEKLAQYCAEKDAEIEMLDGLLLKAQNDAEKERFQCKNICEPTYKNLLETARAEAIDEFAASLEKHFCHDPAFLGVEQRLIMDVVKQKAKELKGESDGKSGL